MRKAFTLIELIVTIVIIGIAASALPVMMAGANKLEEETVNQDVFFKSITIVSNIISRYWDDAILSEDRQGNGAMVVDVVGGDALLSRVSGTQYRIGSFGRAENDFRKFYATNPTLASDIPPGGTAIISTEQIESLERYNGRYINETTGDARVRYDIAVAYVPDIVTGNTDKNQTATWNLSGGVNWMAKANSTNLKRITVTASGRSVSGQPMSINFVYFSSNIGTPGIKKQ